MYEFMTCPMIAKKSFPYAGRQLSAGEDFMATPHDAEYFEKHGKAEKKPALLSAAPVAPSAVPAAPIVPISAQAVSTNAPDSGAADKLGPALAQGTSSEAEGLGSTPPESAATQSNTSDSSGQAKTPPPVASRRRGGQQAGAESTAAGEAGTTGAGAQA